MTIISSRQERIIGCIRDFLREMGFPPAIRDIQSRCNISSTSVVDYNLKVLEKKGYIRRHRDVSRGIELLGGIAIDLVQVPIIGKIAAGQPIPVPAPEVWNMAAISDSLSIPRDLTRGREGVFALKVKGLSMIDALINDGDIVLMQSVNVVENGEMAAVWLKAEKETTLKKVYVESDRVRLQPANSSIKPIYAAPDNIEIQGRVIGVIRQLV